MNVRTADPVRGIIPEASGHSGFLRAAVWFALLVSGCRAAPSDPATDGERPPRRFLEPTAEFPAVFTAIRAVMALPDGRLVLSDPLENRVNLIDFDKDTSRLLGRVGEGPLEFKRAAGLYRAPGGGVWVFDHELRRLLPVLPTGALQEVIQVGYGGLAGDVPAHGPDDLAFDSLGYTYDNHGGGSLTAESSIVVRHRAVGRQDTVTKLLNPVTKAINVKRNGTGLYRSVLFSPEDAWVVAPDGWVAVARAVPYRVEWIPPAGPAVSGPVISHKPIRISQEEKEFIASGAGGGRGTISVSLVLVPPGGPTHGGRPGPPEPMSVKELLFAKVKSPVNLRQSRWPLLDERGRLWVPRSLPFGLDVNVFDVFDRAGNVVNRVELPAGSRLVGFDTRWIYTSRKDADDFEHLQRFPLPL